MTSISTSRTTPQGTSLETSPLKTLHRTSRRSFVLMAASAAFTGLNGLLSGCGGGSATQVSPPVPLPLSQDPLSQDPLFQITDLGIYDQFTPSILNNREEIIGYGPERNQGALLRSPNGAMQTLGLPAGVSGPIEEVRRVALNDNGASLVTIVVRESSTGSTGSTTSSNPYLTHTFLWQNGVAQNIGSLGGRHTEGYDLNNRNQIIGFSDILNPGDPGYGTHSFLWQEGRMSELTLPAQRVFNPWGINDNGVMFGEALTRTTNASNGSGYEEDGAAILANGIVTLLRETNSTEYRFNAMDLNNRGQVVGWAFSTKGATSSGGSGYLLENGVATNLSVVGGEVEFNAPAAINGFGSVVGGTLPKGGWGGHFPWKLIGRAFLYQGGKTYDLQTRIPADSGWVLRGAYDINDRGQILGRGVVDGEGHAFLLTPTTTR
ncbi:MAG: hypothetical protein V4671_30230 [Armatimonadota bacterium]